MPTTYADPALATPIHPEAPVRLVASGAPVLADIFDLRLTLSGGSVTIVRAGTIVLTAHGVREVRFDSHPDHPGMGLLRLVGERMQLCFVDHADGCTNVREVSARLPDLQAVLAWLLPPGYRYRQGDIGFYARPALPAGAAPVPADAQPEVFAPVLGRRHLFESAEHCDFFVLGRAYFARVQAPTRLLHPEHGPVLLAPGIYELRRARGRSLPGVVFGRASPAELVTL